jgi:hypothetical protein
MNYELNDWDQPIAPSRRQLLRARDDVGRENGGHLHLGFERFQCLGDDLTAQLSVQLRRQARIAARMGN